MRLQGSPYPQIRTLLFALEASVTGAEEAEAGQGQAVDFVEARKQLSSPGPLNSRPSPTAMIRRPVRVSVEVIFQKVEPLQDCFSSGSSGH